MLKVTTTTENNVVEYNVNDAFGTKWTVNSEGTVFLEQSQACDCIFLTTEVIETLYFRTHPEAVKRVDNNIYPA